MLCRRVALASLARACADFVPSSYDDAVAVRGDVAGVLDAEARVAADGGDVSTCLTLRALRTTLVDGLTTRAAQLPRLATFTRAASLPALTLAYQIYGDTTRADDLVARADPPHPASMPLAFVALAD